MFCPKCGSSLPENSEFCSNCGTKLKDFEIQQMNIVEENHSTNSTETMTEMFSKNSQKFINPILDKIKQFCLKYKKQISIGLVSCFILSIGILLFTHLYDFTKISWDTEYGDSNVTHTQASLLTLKVLAYDKKNNPIEDIEFSVDDGEIVSEGSIVKWTLPKEMGSYTITAKAPSGKKISKSVKVVKIAETETYISGVVSEPVDDEVTDSDEDGLMNAEEKELGTNIYSADTDADGLPDKLEIEETKTDPLKKDSDGDGIDDGDEMDLDLDPLKVDSKGDGIKDGDRTLTYSIEQSDLGISMEITGKGNIASSTIDLIENSTFSNMEGVLSTVYNFYTEGTLDSAIVKIEYNEDDFIQKGLDEENLTFYYFNEETKQLEEIPTEVDIESKTLTVTLKHFSKYVIGDRDVVLTNTSSQIMFLIDNSVSMYSESQMDEAGYYSTGAIGNDTEFKRLSLTNKMIDMFTGNYKFGVAEFAGTYVNLSKFTNDTTSVKNAVNSMKFKWNSNTNGTNIIEALNKGIDEFNQDEDHHYIILLTDGKNTEGSMSSSKSTLIENAKEKNIKVCVIGLGSNIDTDDLNMIAESTGCDYYNAVDSSALDEIYSLVGADINYSFVDTDKDSKTDGMIMADSGFIVTRDGFSFDNFISSRSEGGHCYGMATFAMLYYTKQLPLSLEKAHKWTIFKRFPESNGYDLTDTFISRGQNLYDYKFTDDGLKLFFNPLPSDYRDRVEDRTWLIKKEYYDVLDKIGSIFSIHDYNGEDFDKYQSALLNIDNETFNNAVVKDESQLLDAIYRLFILQVDDKSTPFGSSPDKAFKELNENLNDGVPAVVVVAGNHAINAIRLIQDNDNSNQFKIEVYDNNYPGETRYINVTRSKFSKFALNYTAWTNTYSYTFTYDAGNDGTAEELSVDLRYPIVE